MQNLKYNPFERISIRKPVDRIAYISNQCKDKTVIDIWCYDETSLIKKETSFWLHWMIAKYAKKVIWVDNSSKLPEDWIKTWDDSVILKWDITTLDRNLLSSCDILIAWELIEHINNVEEFFLYIKQHASWKTFICSTPNATAIYNGLLALGKRESQHEDHVHIFSYKTLNTLCKRAWFENWEIIPYHVRFTEMILKSRGLKKIILTCFQKTINLWEYLFPLTSWGMIVKIKI